MKNIGMILQSKFPPDIRVEKEARSLIKAGFSLYLLCMDGGEAKKEEIINGIFVKRILPRRKPILRKIHNFISYLIFFNPAWSKQIDKFILKNRIETLHLHDLPLISTVLRIAKRRKVSVIADLHENYPAALKYFITPKNFLIRSIIDENRWKRFEKRSLEKADRIIVVVEEAKKRIINYDISEKKIEIVSNVEDVEMFSSIPIDERIVSKYNKLFTILYVGGLGPL